MRELKGYGRFFGKLCLIMIGFDRGRGVAAAAEE
jgi:hypothetical protein